MVIAFICSLFNFFLLPLIPTKIQIRQFRAIRDEEFEEVKKKRRERRVSKEAMMMGM